MIGICAPKYDIIQSSGTELSEAQSGRAINSVGQSATFTRLKSGVQVPHRPPIQAQDVLKGIRRVAASWVNTDLLALKTFKNESKVGAVGIERWYFSKVSV